MSSVKAGSRGYVKRAEDNIPAGELRSEPAVIAHEPFFVRRARVTRPVGPTQCDEMKLVFANRGKTEIFHRRGGICLSPRKVVFLPAEQTYWGVPAWVGSVWMLGGSDTYAARRETRRDYYDQ